MISDVSDLGLRRRSERRERGAEDYRKERKSLYSGRDTDEDSHDGRMARLNYRGRGTGYSSDDMFPLEEDLERRNRRRRQDSEEDDEYGMGRRRTRRHSSKRLNFRDFYELTDEHLGSGAYASVRTCISREDGQEYAVKIVDKQDESHTRWRLLREVSTFEMCEKCDNIVKFIDWYEDESNFYMVFEKLHGGPLLQHIIRKTYFTEEEARRVTKDIATALRFLHGQGIAHRDIKPENILCTERDRVSPVKICDLDLASRPMKSHSPPKVVAEPDLASPVGSAEFMAPEVVDAFIGESLKYDKRCDMWSLGVIIYIMLCGYAPFQGECTNEDCGWMEGRPCDDCQRDLFTRIQLGDYDFPEEEWGMISQEAKDLVRHLLVKNVNERYTADQVLEHPWVRQQSAPPTMLQTASNLFRNDSARDMQKMSETFNAVNRGRLSTQLQRMSVQEEEDLPSPTDSEDSDSQNETISINNKITQTQAIPPQYANSPFAMFMTAQPPLSFFDPYLDDDFSFEPSQTNEMRIGSKADLQSCAATTQGATPLNKSVNIDCEVNV